jgi:peptide/nickel transport system substrate-binding protein
LHDGYARFRTTEELTTDDWLAFDVDRANKLLDDAGYRQGADGLRLSHDGTPFQFDVNVVTGWSDWMRAAQIIAQGFRRIGIVSAARAYDFSAYFDKLQKGDFGLSIGWTSDEPSPYHFYRGLMSNATVKAIGEPAPLNWHRFGSEKADALLTLLESAAEESEQLRLAYELERIFATDVPAIPLFLNPAWAEFNSRYFDGFPTKTNPYAKPSPYSAPECLLVLTRLKQRPA